MARRRSRQATEEALLDAATDLIVETGPDGFTLSDLANRAGVNRALIYHYFRDRGTLLDRAVERAVRRSLENRSQGGDLAGVEDVFRVFVRQPELPRFFLRFLMAGHWPGPIRERFMVAVDGARWLQAERGVDFDAEMAVILTAQAAMLWACTREEHAAGLGIPVEEADRRFLAALTGDAGQKLAELLPGGS